MAAPLLYRRRILAAQVEGTVGTMETDLSATDAAFNVFNATMEPVIDVQRRDGQGAGLSKLPAVPGAHGATCTFSVELTSGSGATPPGWASTFLPACGYGATSGVFAPDSRPPGASSSGLKTLTIWLYVDGKIRKMYGAMGNAVLRFISGRIVMIDFTFTGVWGGEVDGALIAPDYPSAIPLRFTNSSFVIGSYSPVIAECTLDLGNQIILRESANVANSTAYLSALIVDRNPNGTLVQEADLVANYNPISDFLTPTERALSLSLGDSAGTITVSAPKFQITGPRWADRNGLQVDQLAFQLNKSTDAGDDELKFEFAANE